MAAVPLSLLKKIQKIHIQTTHLANDILAGAYRSAFKGKGMEFEEVREYIPGDDVRNIDWNVTARMNHPYVKSFREERELTVTLAVDISASTHYGSGKRLKCDLIAEVAAVIAFSAIKSNDKIALILFSNKIEKYLPAKKGTRHVLRIIRELLTYTPQERGTNITNTLTFLGKVQQRAGICFLISDFISPSFAHAAAIISKHHDLVPIAIVDPTENHFPNFNLVMFQDLETDQIHLVDTDSTHMQNTLNSTTEQRLKSQRFEMLKIGTDMCFINTQEPYVPQLRKYFAMRKRRYR